MTDTIKIKKSVKLNYDHPIIHIHPDGGTNILLPQQKHDGYKVMGYNWLDLENLTWNSCCTFKTKEHAVESYGIENCFNVDIEL